METIAFIHSAIAYEDPAPEPQFRSWQELSSGIPSSAWIQFTGVVVAVSLLLSTHHAQAIIKRGDICPAVRSAQQALIRNGHDIGPSGDDGAFGNDTEYAVMQFQLSEGLEADGVIGARTARALELSANISCNAAVPFDASGGSTATVNTISSPLNVRSGPGMGYTVIGSLAPGADIVIVDSMNGWEQLTSGGWVSSQYVSAAPVPIQVFGVGGPSSSTSFQVATNGSPLNVRSGPGPGYAVISTLPNGRVVETINTSGGWYQLPGGGWVSGAWLRSF